MSKIEINKNTRGLRIATSDEVFTGRNHRILRNPTHIYGRIEREYPHVVLTRSNRNRTYKDDFSKLSTCVKKEVVDRFNNYGTHNRRVLYLVDSQFNQPVQNNTRVPRNPRNRNNNRNNNRG